MGKNPYINYLTPPNILQISSNKKRTEAIKYITCVSMFENTPIVNRRKNMYCSECKLKKNDEVISYY